MKYGLLPKTMWAVFAPTFKKNLHIISAQNPNAIMKNAHARYREILNQVQEFDKGDNFILNILSAAMLAAVYLELDKKPNIEQLTEFYQCAMGNFVMRIYLKNSNQFTEKHQSTLKTNAEKSHTRNNPYFRAGKDINSFTAIFTTCGICHLMNTLRISEIVPAMCHYDYVIAEQTGTIFTREYTLATGGPYCDCNYKKNVK